MTCFERLAVFGGDLSTSQQLRFAEVPALGLLGLRVSGLTDGLDQSYICSGELVKIV